MHFQPLELRESKQAAEPNESNQIRKGHVGNTNNTLSERELYWMVQWRKPQYKKHKTWDGDGVLVIKGSKAELYNSDGKIISSGRAPGTLPQHTFFVGDKEMEFDRHLSPQEYLSGSCFSGSYASPTEQHPSQAVERVGCRKPYISLTRTSDALPANESPHPVYWKAKLCSTGYSETVFALHRGSDVTILSGTGDTLTRTIRWQGEEFRPGLHLSVETKEVELEHLVEGLHSHNPREHIEPVLRRERFMARQNTSSLHQRKDAKPLHDPNAPGAIVMKVPPRHNAPAGPELPVVPVVLDPILAHKMRPHQIEGVRFMYESVMGLRKHEGQGCILADEMGLGKSLQTIALIWTLLKQNFYAGHGPAAKKVLLVCPVTLLNNWKAEFHKWLGRDRINIVVCDKDTQVAQTFANAKKQEVLIIGYERLRTVMKYLSFSVPPIDLIICDEGHRLKSLNNKTTEIFGAFRTARKIILSGTPIQNDLREFHAMAEFCNAGLLDEYSTFRRIYETPILRGRAPGASTTEVQLGKLRSKQLHAIAKSFVLRRDASVVHDRLPPKYEYVVFVIPTSLQLALYAAILQSEKMNDLVRDSQNDSLALIGMLVKISNSPILLKATIDNFRGKSRQPPGGLDANDLQKVLALVPQEANLADVSLSGKLIVLSKLLHRIHKTTDEKCVLVSHYTSTLSILEEYCNRNSYTFLRLDGQTPANKRQGLVDKFNKSSQKSTFIFLLSSKAGGVGINLTGASRLFLIDCDWNPSHDVQAMARCHRDGQKRAVFIYRLLTTGTIDEKIYQRQVTKLDLSGALIGETASSKGDLFGKDDLRDIFRVNPTTTCNTHDLLGCQCTASNTLPMSPAEQNPLQQDHSTGFVVASQIKAEPMVNSYLRLTALHEWKHISCAPSETEFTLEDETLNAIIDSQKEQWDFGGRAGGGMISFIFEKRTIDTSITVEA